MLLKHKRTMILFIISSVLLSMSAFVVFAGELVLTGEITPDTSAGWTRPLSYGDAFGYYDGQGNCTYGTLDQHLPYTTHTIQVTEPGNYFFDLQTASVATDFQILLYGPDHPFEANGARPCIAHVDDAPSGASCCPQMTVNLEPGIAYTIVVTTYVRREYGPYSIFISGPGEIIQSTNFLDGRVNYRDGATPIVVFPDDNNGIIVYSDAGDWLFNLADILNSGGECATETTVLYTHESPYIIVSQLPDCRIQINATMYNGKTYILIFLDFAGYYESYEIE